MQLMPRSAFMRLLLVFAVMLAGFLLTLFVLIRSLSIGSDGESYAAVIINNIDLARERQRSGLQVPINARFHREAPETSAWVTGLQNDLLERLQNHYGKETKLGFTYGDSFSLWIQQPKQNDWLEIQLPKYLQSFLQSVGWLLGFFVFTVLIAAWAASRWVIKPMVRLAEEIPVFNTNPQMVDEFDKNAPDEVNMLRQQMLKTWRAQQDAISTREFLLAGVSHDLRTPLARLRFALELNEMNKHTGREEMQNDMQEMEDILQQYLDYCRSGSEEKISHFDLSLTIRDLCEEASARGYEWQTKIPRYSVIQARELSVRRALRNLMRNAELHGSAPYQIALDTGEDNICVSVQDQGSGVDNKTLAQLGQAFFRGEPSRSGVAGSGLGLALVSRTAAIHGGKLKFNNRTEGGFEASLRLPILKFAL
jgi:two-component system, OmpR family, osmolarity sensor histidine kinase EnvZ